MAILFGKKRNEKLAFYKLLLKILNKIHEVLKLRLCIKAVKIRLSICAHEIKITRYVTHLFGHLGECPLSQDWK